MNLANDLMASSASWCGCVSNLELVLNYWPLLDKRRLMIVWLIPPSPNVHQHRVISGLALWHHHRPVRPLVLIQALLFCLKIMPREREQLIADGCGSDGKGYGSNRFDFHFMMRM